MKKTIPKQDDNRIWEVDVIRALAVLGMIYFHVLYLLDFWYLKDTPLFTNDGWIAFANTIRNSFFIVVGLGMTLSYQRCILGINPLKNYYLKQTKKALILLLLGLGATGVSLLLVPDKIIVFGVLSFIGASIILTLPFIGNRFLLAMLIVSILLLKTQSWSQDSLAGYILGFYPSYRASIDYFPIFPWLAAVASGALIGDIMFKNGWRRYPFIQNPPPGFGVLVWIGKKALLLYIVHLPIIAFIIWLLQKSGIY